MFLKLDPSCSAQAHEEGCAEVEDLFVRPDRRGQGIGGRLLAEAEAIAQREGHPKLGLAVEIDSRATRLYLRSGYEPTRHRGFVARWATVDDEGTVRESVQICDYLVKLL